MKINIDNIEVKLKSFESKIPDIEEVLRFATDNKCSDVYIKVGDYPYITRYGKLYKVKTINTINDLIWSQFANKTITSENNAKYIREKMLDIPLEIKSTENNSFNVDKYRYRVSVGFSMGKNVCTFRVITPKKPSFKSINFPEKEKQALELSFKNKTGIVIMAGATGSGKSIYHKQKLKVYR